ncbi:SDR family NAD(P)-dependent oxidoreductase [Rhodococcus sp. NCIMB 12038]|uniref:SDR family NAD(P)-dependent oxidoreductase n=1 Tax=Rhodococcus sp. NCIMB 12038 TaxID=933800 RepID=UPI000B3CD683|nr:SDR family NAD(P)-dependent oxidoreductase [Rhodococcus sp. NCIMB 12038]OUS87621.1 3-oxoacyl-ACP reductase [Rhodococcus sp. NCIMB 12038]
MSSTKTGRLAGKRVLITGTGGGQGEAAQRLFASEGATVIGCDLKGGAAEATAATLREEGYDVWGSTVDLADPEQAGAWVREGAERMGGLDVLYNNAAGAGFAPFDRMDFALWRHVISVELDLVFHTTNAAWPLLLDGGGSLINVGSYSALRGIEALAQVAHAAAKGGIIAMTRSLAAEGAARGVRANSISPGFISTPATDKAVDAEGKAWQISNALIQRAGTGDDIAYMALYLASDESSWVTGQNFSVDGGATAGWRDDAETARVTAKNFPN